MTCVTCKCKTEAYTFDGQITVAGDPKLAPSTRSTSGDVMSSRALRSAWLAWLPLRLGPTGCA